MAELQCVTGAAKGQERRRFAGRAGGGHLIRGTEDVGVILLEAPQPRQPPQAAGGLGPVQGPEVRQPQGQLSPGSGPVGEHQAEGGVGRAQHRRADWPRSLLCPSARSCPSLRVLLAPLSQPQPCLAQREFLRKDSNRREAELCPCPVKQVQAPDATRRGCGCERAITAPNSHGWRRGGLETQRRRPSRASPGRARASWPQLTSAQGSSWA